MIRGRGWRVLVLLTAVCAAVGIVPLASAPAGAGSLDAAAWYLMNDSPFYGFADGPSAPTRNEPLAVMSLRGFKVGSGLELDITNVVSFTDTAQISGRLGFYSAPARRPMVYGGIEFRIAGTGAFEATLVEREEAGTATSAEAWGEADEDFADVSGEYNDQGVHIVIKATGSYRKLLKDPLTTVGFDLWTGAPGTNVQPSARVSVGDLTGKKPGLLPQQGTSVAADGTPQPWITQPVGDDFFGWRVRASAKAADPQHVTVDLGKYARDALEIRTFIASEFEPLAPGGRFPAYQLVLFMPGQTSARLRLGDAFLSSEAQSFTIGRKGKKFSLEFSSQLSAGYANVQAIVPGQTDAVLLATGFQYKF